MAFWFRPLPICILLTSGWCTAKVMLWAAPLFFHAKELDCPSNHQPLTQWNKPSYYKHNRAYYRASVILVLLPSKTRIRLIKVRPSLYHTPFLFFNSCKVNVFRWCCFTICSGHPACRRPGRFHLQDLWVSEVKRQSLEPGEKPGELSHQVPVSSGSGFKEKNVVEVVCSDFLQSSSSFALLQSCMN